MHPIDIRKYKQDLRLKCREERRNMPSEKKQELDRKIAENVRRLKEYKPAKTLLIYMSTPIEVDTVEIIKNAWVLTAHVIWSFTTSPILIVYRLALFLCLNPRLTSPL